MTLQQLHYFRSACRYKNISLTAQKINVSQPAISLAIKNLEKEFGCALITREKVGFSLTSEGQELLKLAEDLLDHAKDVESIMKDISGGVPSVTIGIPPMASALLLPEILIDLKKCDSDINILTREGGKDDLLQLLENNMIEMAFFPHSLSLPEQYSHITVKEFETVCCLSSEHPLSNQSEITPNQLDSEPLVLFSEGYFQNERIKEIFDAAGAVMSPLHRSSQLSTIEELVRNNIAVGFLFSELAERIPGICALSLVPPIKTQISLVWKKDRRLKPGMARFIKLIENIYHINTPL